MLTTLPKALGNKDIAYYPTAWLQHYNNFSSLKYWGKYNIFQWWQHLSGFQNDSSIYRQIL